MKIYDMILFAIAYILFVSSRVRAERLSMSGVASVWKRNGGSSSACPTAVAVAWAESRGDTKARGQNSNSYDRGLWQINSYWHRDVKDNCAYDKNCNAKNAVRISSNGRKWSPWATYNDGLHRRWMDDAKKACGGSYDILGENLVGGGKVYGEYNKGPIKAGGEYNWDEDANDDVGGGRVYGEYNKGPYKVGAEHNWDEQVGISSDSVGGVIGPIIRAAPHVVRWGAKQFGREALKRKIFNQNMRHSRKSRRGRDELEFDYSPTGEPGFGAENPNWLGRDELEFDENDDDSVGGVIGPIIRATPHVVRWGAKQFGREALKQKIFNQNMRHSRKSRRGRDELEFDENAFDDSRKKNLRLGRERG